MSLRIRRGTNAQRTSITFDLGEIVYTTDTQKLYIGDGVTAGGKNLLETSAGNGFTFNPTTQQIDFAIGNLNLNTAQVSESSNLYFTTERAQDAVGAALVAGNAFNTGVTFTYDDANNRITAVSTGGLTNISADTTPSLGGNLNLATRSITGTGSIGITGNIVNTGNAQFTGTIQATTGLGGNLGLNGFNISGAGAISATSLSSTTLTATNLGGNLGLNGFNISGAGAISATSLSSTTLTATNLGGNLNAGAFNITGVGSLGATTVTAGSLITPSISKLDGASTIRCLTLNNNNVAVGTSTVPLELRIVGLKDTAISVNSISTGTFDGGGLFTFNVSSGTHAVPTKIAAEGLIGGFSFNGYNGTTYKTGGAVFAQVATGTDTTGASFIKTNLLFATSNGTSEIDIGLTVRNDKVAESPCFRATPFADGLARNTAIASPQAGMVIYLTSTNKLQVYTGSAWVDLH